MQLSQDPALSVSGSSLGCVVRDGVLHCPERVIEFTVLYGLRTAEVLVDYLETFPSVVEVVFGMNSDDARFATEELRRMLAEHAAGAPQFYANAQAETPPAGE